MTEINSLGAQTALSPQSAKAAMTGELLRLLQPQPGLLPPGETARAEVLSLRQVGQDFQMLLRLTQQNGSQTQLQASANQPLPQGTQVMVTQTESNRLAVLVQQANVATLTRLDTTQVPVGTLLQGKVLTSQALPQTAGELASFRSLVSLLNSRQAGATLSIDSPRPLPVGSLLSALVQGDQSLRFVPLSGRQDQLAIAQQLQTQQGQQASLPSLLTALQQLASSPDVGSELRASAERLLASLPDARQLSDPKTLAQALNNSGSFLEAKLLGGQASSTPLDLKAQLVKLIAQLPGSPAGSAANPALLASTLAQALPGFARSALGMLGQVSPRPQPGAFPLPERLLQSLEDKGDLQQLLRLAAAAVSRLQSHALSSLQQTGTLENGNLQTSWQTEIPVRHGQEFIPLQVKLQREETPEQQADREREQRDPLAALWRIELAFDLAPLGPLQVQAQLAQGRLSGQLWAEHERTAQLIASQLGTLRERLLDRGLDVGDLECHPGSPPQGPRTRLEQRWVDETA